MAAFRARTYRRTVDSATAAAGISRRSRIQSRCAVCRCFLGALRSDSRIASMNGIAAASFGRSRSGTLRSAGIALYIAGLKMLGEKSGGRFSDLSAARQIEMLRSIEKTDFFDLVRQHTIMGFFS